MLHYIYDGVLKLYNDSSKLWSNRFENTFVAFRFRFAWLFVDREYRLLRPLTLVLLIRCRKKEFARAHT